jgi:nuclear transcription factor Y gamma
MSTTNPDPPLDDFLRTFWSDQIKIAEEENPDFKHPSLPLARIKKVMKSDPDVKVCGNLLSFTY